MANLADWLKNASDDTLAASGYKRKRASAVSMSTSAENAPQRQPCGGSGGILTLAYPPSANRYWRNVSGRMVKSKDARDYQSKAGWLAKEFGLQPVSGDVSITIRVYRPAKRGDLDNSLKIVIDSLKGIAYQDDNQIVSISATRFDDKVNPRVEIEIKPLTSVK